MKASIELIAMAHLFMQKIDLFNHHHIFHRKKKNSNSFKSSYKEMRISCMMHDLWMFAIHGNTPSHTYTYMVWLCVCVQQNSEKIKANSIVSAIFRSHLDFGFVIWFRILACCLSGCNLFTKLNWLNEIGHNLVNSFRFCVVRGFFSLYFDPCTHGRVRL